MARAELNATTLAVSRKIQLRMLLQSVGASAAMRAVSAVLGLATTVVLARSLGAEGLGRYAVAFSLAMLLAIPTQAGLPTLVLREVARYRESGSWSLMRGILRGANILAIVLSLLIACTASVIVLVTQADRYIAATYVAALCLIPLLSVGNVRAAALQGLGHVVIGQLPEYLIRPIGLLLLLLVFIAVEQGLTPLVAMLCHLIALALAFIIGAALFKLKAPLGYVQAGRDWAVSKWARSLLPLSLMSGFEVMNLQLGVLLLGVFRPEEEVGIYRASMQIATLVVFGLSIVNSVLAPRIARLFLLNDKAELQALVRGGTRIVMICSVPAVVLCIIFGERLLTLLFGEPFGAGYLPLLILCAGQFVCALLGPTVLILNMAGEERETVRGMAMAGVLGAVLAASLAPSFGMVGVALAMASSAIVLNTYFALRIRRRLGLNCGPFSKICASIDSPKTSAGNKK